MRAEASKEDPLFEDQYPHLSLPSQAWSLGFSTGKACFRCGYADFLPVTWPKR